MGSARRRAESHRPGIRIHAPVVVRHIAPGEADAAVVTAPARACVEPAARTAAAGATHSDEHRDVRGAARAGGGTTASSTDNSLHSRRSAKNLKKARPAASGGGARSPPEPPDRLDTGWQGGPPRPLAAQQPGW